MRKRYGWLLILLFSFWAVKPLLQKGLFQMHDDTQVVRVFEMARALKEGQFPVRWVADLGYGYGYPIFNFYAPLAYYTGASFVLIGFDVLMATKLMMIIGIIFSGVAMYLLAREFWGETGGIISGLFYLYAPYHAVDIYVRGAVGEFWAMAFLPLVFLAIYKLYRLTQIQGDKASKIVGLKWAVAEAVFLAAVILSHNLTALMLMPFLLAVSLILFFFSKNKKFFIFIFLLQIILGIGLAAFYWLPALTELKYTRVSQMIETGSRWQDNFVFLDQIWASPWGFGGSAPGRLDGMSFMVGKAHLTFSLAALILSLFSFLRLKTFEISSVKFGPIGVGFGLLGAAIFLTNGISRPIWELIKPMAFFQYPWRFLIMATLSSSFLAGSVIFFLKGRIKIIFTLLLALGILGISTKYFQPQFIKDADAESYINEENIKWTVSKISDEYLPKDFPIPKDQSGIAWEKTEVLKGKIEVKNQLVKAHLQKFELLASGGAELLINTAYFPGWQVFQDGQLTNARIDAGKLRLVLPSGEHKVIVRFCNTPIRTISNMISLFFLIGILSPILYFDKEK